MRSNYLLVFLVIVMIAVTVGCSPAPPPEPTATPVPTVHPGKAVMNSYCTACHDIGRVTNHKADPESWGLTVDRMILTGAKVPQEKRDLLVDYLAQTYPKE